MIHSQIPWLRGLVALCLAGTAAAQGPTADAGPDQFAQDGAWAGLTANASVPNLPGDTLTYLWSQVGGTPLNLKNTTRSTAYFEVETQNPGVLIWNFQVTVTDQNGFSDTDTCKVTLASTPAQFLGDPTSLAPYRTAANDLTDDEVRHLAEAISFGLGQSELATLQSLGSATYVGNQLGSRVTAVEKDVARTDAGVILELMCPTRDYYTGSQNQFETYVLNLMFRDSAAQLHLKDFYRTHNRWATSTGSLAMADGWMRHDHTEVLLRGALTSDYRQFVYDVTLDPAMLLWLDGINNNIQSPSDIPQENYARELLELFTLGESDPYTGNPNYDETDVQNIAKALTGWRFQIGGGGQCDFRELIPWPPWHETGGPWPVVLSEPPATNIEDVNDVVDAILARRQWARALALDLFEYYAGFTPLESVVDDLADDLEAGRDLVPVVSRILLSNAMFSSQARRAKTKSPLEHVVGVMRKLEMNIAANAPVRDALQDLGHAMLAPPSVKGWPGPTSTGWIGQGRLIDYMAWTEEFVDRKTNSGTPNLTPFYPDTPGLDDACSFAYSFARKWGIPKEEITEATMDTWVGYLNWVYPGQPNVDFDLDDSFIRTFKGMGFVWLVADSSLQYVK